MKKLIISLIIILSICSVFSSFLESRATCSLGQVNVFPKANCEKLLTYNGVPIRTTYVAYIKDGVEYPAYCLDVNASGVEEGEYVVSGNDKLTNVNVWKAIINGFPYKSIEELGAANGQEAFTATKQAVYTMLYDRDINSYGPVNSDSGRRTYQIYCNIVNSARSMQANIETNVVVNLANVSTEWKQDNLNPEYISKEYYATSNVTSGNYEVSIKGVVPENTKIVDMSNNQKNTFAINEHFKILMPIANLFDSEGITISANAKLDTKPVMYGSTTVPGKQDYALTGMMYEEVGSELLEGFNKNETKIIVRKFKEGTEQVLEGVKFVLTDEKGDVVRDNLVTDAEGKIVIENLMPGKYHLREVETLDGYELAKDEMEIEVQFGEEKEVRVDNTEIPTPEPEPEPEPTPVVSVVPKKLPKTGF